jgi:hypothetical protein
MEDVLTMSDAKLADLVVAKFMKHVPCLIRFAMNPQKKDGKMSGVTFEDHTGILFGCHYLGKENSPFELGIYFKDPLSIESPTSKKRNSKVICTIERSKRVFKVFNCAAFTGTCYYNIDEFGKNTTHYKKDAYNHTKIQLIPNDESSWTKTINVFPFAKRAWIDRKRMFRFLSGDAEFRYPIQNTSLLEQLSPILCDPLKFKPICGRSSLIGRGRQKRQLSVDTKPNSKQQRTTCEEVVSLARVKCPGCERFMMRHPEDNGCIADNSHQSQDCCNIQVCLVNFIKIYLFYQYLTDMC